MYFLEREIVCLIFASFLSVYSATTHVYFLDTMLHYYISCCCSTATVYSDGISKKVTYYYGAVKAVKLFRIFWLILQKFLSSKSITESIRERSYKCLFKTHTDKRAFIHSTKKIPAHSCPAWFQSFFSLQLEELVCSHLLD